MFTKCFPCENFWVNGILLTGFIPIKTLYRKEYNFFIKFGKEEN